MGVNYAASASNANSVSSGSNDGTMTGILVLIRHLLCAQRDIAVVVGPVAGVVVQRSAWLMVVLLLIARR